MKLVSKNIKEEVFVIGCNTACPPERGGAAESRDIHPGDADRVQAPERLADFAAGAGGVPDSAVGCERPAGRKNPVSEGRRVSGQSRAYLQKIQAELEHNAAVRELGRTALAFVLGDREKYVKWHIAAYGYKPEGF